MDAFDSLHIEARRWIRDQGWDELRDIQARAINAVMASDADVLIAASTAAGKTEAAFLPVLSRVADRTSRGAAVLYISPLKALINDQFRRLELLCEWLNIDVIRWHGDAPQAAKSRALKRPSGVVLITPESIEALLARRTTEGRALLGALDFVIIDELHAFLQGPRGLQLSSLLSRIDAFGPRARRIGLSATLGDLEHARAWLNPDLPQSVVVLESNRDSQELRLQVRGYVRGPDEHGPDGIEDEDHPVALDQVADHAFSVLRGSNNLLFAGARRSVEALADRLRRRSERHNVPNEFFPHHGSLSRDLREELEARLKRGDLPTTAIATTTLELGIDIGSVRSAAQLGAPRSLASLRQRLGRSGRRKGTPAILRIYVREPYLQPSQDPLDQLRSDVVRAVAAVRLLLERFVEPPTAESSLPSVVLHQTLALIAQFGGARAPALYTALRRAAPFRSLSTTDFADLLRHMASSDVRLLEQSPDGLIMLGEAGERLVGSRDFYAVFQTDEEWRLVSGARTLGTVPLTNEISVGGLIVFAGQRWRVTTVDDRSKVLEVVPHRSGQLPKFDRLHAEPIHDRLAMEVRAVYLDTGIPPYLDQQAAILLQEGRENFARYHLDQVRLLPSENDTHILTWRGNQLNALLAILLNGAGLACEAHDMGVTVPDTSLEQLQALLRKVPPTPEISVLGEFVSDLRTAKFDGYISDALLRRHWVRSNAPLGEKLSALLAELNAVSETE
jgi:ATP-dependent helicase Lhr and Lhr-like helicase